jgi:ABC-type multidrug transport system fused ATPase/permease subunit
MADSLSYSGKSSLILLLLRMLDPLPHCSKNILVDGISLDAVARIDVRDRIITMSQDPVFLPGDVSIKRQLDPFDVSISAECQAVLQLVGLASLAAGVGGLEARWHSESLSGGERQLFNLARIVLRGRARSRALRSGGQSETSNEMGGILLLDEVSSSVDRETERTMLRVIMEEFAKYTVIMVAHHLDMVMGFDRVLVMARGQVVEQGEPRILVKRRDGYFGQLWMAAGSN